MEKQTFQISVGGQVVKQVTVPCAEADWQQMWSGQDYLGKYRSISDALFEVQAARVGGITRRATIEQVILYAFGCENLLNVAIQRMTVYPQRWEDFTDF